MALLAPEDGSGRLRWRYSEDGAVGFVNGKPERSDRQCMSDATKIVLVTVGVSAVLALALMAVTLAT